MSLFHAGKKIVIFSSVSALAIQVLGVSSSSPSTPRLLLFQLLVLFVLQKYLFLELRLFREQEIEAEGAFRYSTPDIEFASKLVIEQLGMAMGRSVLVLFVLVCVMGAFAEAIMVGGPRPIGDFANNLEVDELANFAVDQYKSRLNSIADISFSKVLAAEEQVVQGTMYYLTIEIMEGGVPKKYDAKVWVKPWEGYKELESFLPSAPSHHDPAIDLTATSGDLHENEQIGT